MAETKNENLRFSIYTAFAIALLVLICLTVYICVHFNAAIFSTRHTETYSIIKADTFDTINDNTTPLGIYNELAFTLPAIPKSGSNLVFFVKHESVEVYIDENLVYSIAPDAESAILSAGHAANGAFWMDNTNGKWATTTYYKGIPWYVDRYNNGPESLASRLETMVWTPTLPMEKYNAFPYVLDDLPFRYTFSEKFANCYPHLKTSPFINKEINRLALQFLEYGGFGTRSCPDMLSITYYAGNYRGTMSKEYTREIQDTYYQLDQDIEKLLDTIDKKVGLANTLVVFTGSGYYKSEESYPDGLMVNGGEFHPKRCLALLNMYLMAIYGQHTSWVQGYYDNQIYLNRKAIEDAKLDLTTLQNKAAEFIQEFSGVQLVTTGRSLLTGDWNEGTAKFRQGTHHLRRGDLIIELQPGWKVNLDNPKEKVKIIRNNAVITPLVFMGNGLKPQHIYREVKATEVAPTVTHVLRIRPPNATQSLPLWELKIGN